MHVAIASISMGISANMEDALWRAIVCRLTVSKTGPQTFMTAGAPESVWPLRQLQAVRLGHHEAVEAYVSTFWPVVEREAHRYARLGGSYEDLSGEAALALWEAAMSYDPRRLRSSLNKYVSNMIHQRVRRAYVKERHWRQHQEGLPQDLPVEERALSRWEAHRDLKEARSQLSSGDQALFDQWSALQREGLSDMQIAQRLACRENTYPSTMQKRWQRLRHRLRNILTDAK